MAEPILDFLAPAYVREKRITLELAPDAVLAAGGPVLLLVSYNKCAPEGVMLPLILDVQGPSESSVQRREFRRAAPGSVIIVPREGGPHVVTLRESAHNRWWGSVSFEVAGDRLSK